VQGSAQLIPIHPGSPDMVEQSDMLI